MNYADTIDKIRRLASGEDCCDDGLYELLSKHGCHYLISKSAHYASKQTITLAVNTIVQKKRYQAIGEVIKAIGSDNIKYAHIKGAVLSQRIYGTPTYRSSGDVDLLVPSDYADTIKHLLTSHGYIQGKLENGTLIPYTRKELIFQKSFSHQLAAFIKPTNDKLCQFVNIDVNLDIAWGESDLKIDIDEFISHNELVEIYGVKLNRLKPVWEFISLCMHHYKDMNSIYLIADRGLSLSEYCDIYFYLVNAAPDADELAEAAQRYKVSNYVYYCIYYANEVFADERLAPYLDKLNSESAQGLIDCYGLTDTERRVWDTLFYERLLDVGFRNRFYVSLNDNDKRKVQVNRELM